MGEGENSLTHPQRKKRGGGAEVLFETFQEKNERITIHHAGGGKLRRIQREKSKGKSGAERIVNRNST